jgi:hypothetical protein
VLKSIDSVEFGRGIYHNNWYFNVTLSSPHLETANSEYSFQIIVMKSLDDNVYSFAIDEFPIMKRESIHTFWIDMVEKHKKIRIKSFQQIEYNELELDMKNVGITQSLQSILTEYNAMNTNELKHIIQKSEMNTDDEQLLIFSEIANEILDKRWNEEMMKEQILYDQHIDGIVHNQRMDEM